MSNDTLPVDAVAVARGFAVRLRANADHAERSKFTPANLSTMPIPECRALADWIEARLPLVFVETESPEERYLRDADIACPHCGGSGHKDDVAPQIVCGGEVRLSPWLKGVIDNLPPAPDGQPHLMCRPATPAQDAGAVRVKPLVWRPHIADKYWEANCEIGQYLISPYPLGFFATFNDQGINISGTTVDIVKDAVWADYEQRILSALEPTPPPASEDDEIIPCGAGMEDDPPPNWFGHRTYLDRLPPASDKPAPAGDADDLVGRLLDASDDPYFKLTGGVESWLRRNWALREKAAATITRLTAERDALDDRLALFETEFKKLGDEAVVTADTLGEAVDYWHERATAAETELAASRAEVGSQAATDVLAERRRQIEGEGWTPEYDNLHSGGQLASAAGLYALNVGHAGIPLKDRLAGVPKLWPWERHWWKPTNRRRDLVKAGALILAEIERLDRAALSQKGEG